MARINAKGTLLKMGDGVTPTEVFTTIAQAASIDAPSLKRDTYDTTDHDSPGSWRTFIGGLRDAGEISLEIHYDPALPTHGNTTGLLSNLTTKENPTNWKLVFPDTAATTWSFAALVTAFQPKAPSDNKLTASVTLKLSGQPTLV